MYRKYSHIIFPLVLIVLFPWVLSNPQNVVKVERVVDGDTLLLVNGEKVRLIGIDAIISI
jgi:endonuclease YncB( thermonuclease family)